MLILSVPAIKTNSPYVQSTSVGVQKKGRPEVRGLCASLSLLHEDLFAHDDVHRAHAFDPSFARQASVALPALFSTKSTPLVKARPRYTNEK